MIPVPLSRNFTPIPDVYQREDIPLDEMLPGLHRMERAGWDILVTQHRVVILAEAGAGKTHELRSSAMGLHEQGKPSFFIRIEDIDDAFSSAFEIGSEEAFQSWLAGDSEAWFFLDSVDEVRLSDPRAFERSISAFGHRIRSGLQRAHIYVSSRPYAWRTALDRALMASALPFEKRRQEGTGESDCEDDDGGVPLDTRADDAEAAPTLHLYMLASLGDEDIAQFATHRGVTDPRAFLDALEKAALLPLARLPFDLQDLISTWIENGAFANRLTMLQQGIRRHIDLDWRSAGVPDLTSSRCEEAIRKLAMAVILTGLPAIRLPGGTGSLAIEAATLLPEWSSAEILALLQTGVFGDPIFGEVRFRHREVRELLAAEWAAGLLRRNGGRSELKQLIFRSQHGEEFLARRLRPILPWLILFDAETRDAVLAMSPEVAVEGGDAANLPLEVRTVMLANLMDHLTAPAKGLRSLDNAAIGRIAQPDLEDQVLALLNHYHDNDDVIFALGRLAWQGNFSSCVDPLASIAANASRNIYARIVSVRAVASAGTTAQFCQLWGRINSGLTPIPRRLLAEFATYSQSNAETTALLLQSLNRLELRKEYEVTGLSKALSDFVDRLDVSHSGDAGPLIELAEGLHDLLAQEPYIERGECRVSQAHQSLMNLGLQVVERLITLRSTEALAAPVMAILAAVPALRFYHDDDYRERQSSVGEQVPAWVDLNDRLFWFTVDEHRAAKLATGGVINDVWPVQVLGHFWSFDASAFPRVIGWIQSRDLLDDRLIALSLAFRIYQANDAPTEMLYALRTAVMGRAELEETLRVRLNPPESLDLARYERENRVYRRERRQRKDEEARSRAAFAAEMRADPSLATLPPSLKRGDMSNYQYQLLRTIEGSGMRESRAQGSDWQALIAEFGEPVAQAYRAAALAQWRAYKPMLRSEGSNTNQIPYALIFAMAGLDIEIGDDPAPVLTTAEARRAFRYAVWELNGFPRWLEPLYRMRPKMGRSAIWAEVEWELCNSPADQPVHYILHDIVYYAPWLHPEMSPLLMAWLDQNDVPNQDCLRYCRAIIMGGEVKASDLASLARRKIREDSTPEDQRPSWYAIWTDCEPAHAIADLSKLLLSESLASSTQFALRFVVGLIGSREGSSPIFANFRAPTYLKTLYLLMHRAIPVADDIDRAGKGVYSPTLRDNAQDARDRLLGLLEELPGELTYRAILDISLAHPDESHRDYIRSRAFLHAVASGDLHPWAPAQLVQRMRQFGDLVYTGSPDGRG